MFVEKIKSFSLLQQVIHTVRTVLWSLSMAWMTAISSDSLEVCKSSQSTICFHKKQVMHKHICKVAFELFTVSGTWSEITHFQK
jgi:hypothetical protein